MTMKTDRIRLEELPKRIAVAVANGVDMVLEYSRRSVQESPVLTDLFINARKDGILAGEEGAEGVVEVEVGEIFGVGVSVVGSCAAGLGWAEIVIGRGIPLSSG